MNLFSSESQQKRHPLSPNLTLYYDNEYQGFQVQQNMRGPLILNYLQRTINTIIEATTAQSRILIFRADLRYPQHMTGYVDHADNTVITNFFRYFKNEIERASTGHKPFLRYIWAREQDLSDNHHDHLVIMLSYDVFCNIGYMGPDEYGLYSRDNTYHRLMRSWYRALNLNPTKAYGQLIHIGTVPGTTNLWVDRLFRTDIASIQTAVYNASYLCKAYSKPFRTGTRVFGTSQSR